MKRAIRILVGIVLGAVTILLLSLASQWFGVFVFALPLGWYRFLQRTAANVTINWSAVGLAVICSALILGVGHLLAGQTSRRIWGKNDLRWPFRRTLAGFLIFCWLFIVVMAASGLYRSVAWAVRTKEPLYVERFRWPSELRIASSAVQMLLLDEQTPHIIRDKLTGLTTSNTGTPGSGVLWERWDFVVSEDPAGSVEKVFVFPREPQALERHGATVVGKDGIRSTITAAELRRLLRELR